MWAKQSHGIYMATDRDVPAGGSSSVTTLPSPGSGTRTRFPISCGVRWKKQASKSASKGAHLLRHSLATDMLEKGASLDEIGEVLRHKSPDSTAIYAKVELEALRPLALHWPGGIK
jgi:site-specific recombinase XerD